MKQILKKILLYIIPQKVKNTICEPIIREYKLLYPKNLISISYSQEGEDLILWRIFNSKKDGFYIDVGAHHPKRLSNTYIFSQYGWKGINIDPNPNSIALFNEERPWDINICGAVAQSKKTIAYYLFNESALNTCDELVAKKIISDNQFSLLGKTEVQCFKLCDLLDAHINPSQHIDFLNIDVEGLDLDVLQTNNWEKYRPSIILVELRNSTLKQIINSELNLFLEKINYTLFAKTFNTLIYLENGFQISNS